MGSFTQRAGLNYHRKASHEGLRPHACRLCPFATVKAASLTAHYRNIHHHGGGCKDVAVAASASRSVAPGASEVVSVPLLTPPISGTEAEVAAAASVATSASDPD